MPRGDKSSYSAKQKREAEHIEDSYKRKGVSAETAAARAWATNKQDGGAAKKKTTTTKKTATKKTAAKKSSRRSAATKKAAHKRARKG